MSVVDGVLFGSSYSMPEATVWLELPPGRGLPQQSTEAFPSGNARRVFRLDAAA